MRTNFFCANFLNTPRGLGHPGKIPGTSQIPLFETQGRQTFEGAHGVFGHHPFTWKTPTSPGGLRTQKVNLCALLFRKIVVSVKTFGPQFWGRKWLRQFYGHLEKCVSFRRKTPCHKIPRFRGGGGWGGVGGGADFISMGARIFLIYLA